MIYVFPSHLWMNVLNQHVPVYVIASAKECNVMVLLWFYTAFVELILCHACRI